MFEFVYAEENCRKHMLQCRKAITKILERFVEIFQAFYYYDICYTSNIMLKMKLARYFEALPYSLSYD